MTDECEHKSVTIYAKLATQATRDQQAEFHEWAECDDCGKQGDPSDFPEAEVSDTITVNTHTRLHGAPSEFYD